jgi:chromate transporter
MFIGYASGGVPGLLAAVLGAVIPPTVIMLTVASILLRFQGQKWMENFIKGMSPAVGVLLALVAWQLFRSGGQKLIKWRALLIAALSFLALILFKIPPQYVLIGAGVVGLFLFR